MFIRYERLINPPVIRVIDSDFVEDISFDVLRDRNHDALSLFIEIYIRRGCNVAANVAAMNYYTSRITNGKSARGVIDSLRNGKYSKYADDVEKYIALL